MAGDAPDRDDVTFSYSSGEGGHIPGIAPRATNRNASNRNESDRNESNRSNGGGSDSSSGSSGSLTSMAAVPIDTTIPSATVYPSLTMSPLSPLSMAEFNSAMIGVLEEIAPTHYDALPQTPRGPSRRHVPRRPIPMPALDPFTGGAMRHSSAPPITQPARAETSSVSTDAGTQTDLDTDETTESTITPLTAETAQNHLPAEACLFAANLPMNWDDDRIKLALEECFSQYEQLFVKVKRDPTGLPVAFLQFASVLDATEVALGTEDIVIGGRTLRIEHARCERTLFCSPKSYEGIRDNDIPTIRAVVSEFGPVEDIWRISVQDSDFYHLPPGVWVRFRHYGTCQDAFKGLQHHQYWRFELIRDRNPHVRHVPYPISKILSRSHKTFANRNVFRNSVGKGPLQIGSVIYVEGLPGSTTQFQIRDLFKYFGRVVEVHFEDHFFRSFPNDMPFRSCYVHFREAFAGPAAWAFNCRFGMAIQDASRLIWSSIEVSVSQINYPPVPGAEASFASMPMTPYHNYLRKLSHPAYLVCDDRNPSTGEIPHWNPTMEFRRFYDPAQIGACAPMLGSAANGDHVESLNWPARGTRDMRSGLWVPNGSRAMNYALAQGLTWDETANSAAPTGDGSQVSGMSPLC